MENFEPLKLVRYHEGEYFKPHYDATGFWNQANKHGLEPCDVPYANRVTTLFVYLNTPERGGDTEFTKYGLKVKPRAGMGVIHFPAYLNTSRYTGPGGVDALQVGTKVKGKFKPGAMHGEPGSLVIIGTVVELANGNICIGYSEGHT